MVLNTATNASADRSMVRFIASSPTFQLNYPPHRGSVASRLRDIALTRQRQIFFATADAKIGGLFGRKFRFLGEEFKQIDLTRDDAS